MNPMDMATAERSEIAEFLDTLSPEDWNAASLCRDWRVRDVVAHMISYDGLGAPTLIRWFVRGRFNFSRINAIGVAEAAALTPAQLLDRWRQHLVPTGLSAGFRGGIALVDGVIHHQDIRRGLGRLRSIPADRMVFVLDFALRAPTLPARRITRGLRLVATDLDWARGSGPEVRGPSEALLMAAAGRPSAAHDLTGAGQLDVVSRIGRLDG